MPARKTLQEKAADLAGSEPQTAEEQQAIPPAPPMDPAMGDKTPAYARWVRDYRPEQFATQYAGRRFSIEDIPEAE